MLRYCYVVFAICCLIGLGCDSGTTPDEGPGDFTVIADSTFTLTGGASWVVGNTTMIAYATDIAFTVTNQSDAVYRTGMGLEIGAMVDGTFTTDPRYVIIDTTSLNSINRDRKEIAGHATGILSAQFIVIGRPAAAGWSYPYAWRKKYHDGKREVTLSGSFEGGMNPRNRYRGIIYTVEVSPDPIGIMDGPDDGDWVSSNLTKSQIFPVCPNPVSSTGDSVVCRLSFDLQEEAGPIVFRLMKADGVPLYVYTMNTRFAAGGHVLDLELPKQRTPGTYRLESEITFDDEVVTSRGDILMN